MNIPQGYKQTELGIIPEDWELISIKERGCLVKDGINPMLSPNVSFWEYSMPAFDNGKQPTLSLGEEMHSNRTIIRDTVLLFNKLNVRQQRVWFVESPSVDSVCSMEFLPYVSKSINLEFLYHYLKTDVVTDYFNGISKGTSNSQKRITPQDFLDYKVILPPIAEQRAIAEALSDVDGLIAALDKKIAKKRLLKQGTMQQLLTGKKRLPGFTDEWKYVALEHLLEYEQPTKYLVQSTDYIESGTPVLTAGKTFILGYTTETKGIYTNLPVIIFDDFTTDSKYVTMPFKAKSSAMKMLQLKDRRYNLRLVYELMQLIQFPLYDHQRYWISEYSKLQVYIPSDFKEQQAIATILSDMDKEIADLEVQRDKYRLLKSGMMQKLLTGQIRFKTK